MNRLDRTWRKLREAEFFLDLLRKTAGRAPEFGYHLSAFLSSFKSIGWVLQADLRSQHEADFDDWWKEEKATLPAATIPFSVLTTLRNEAVKKGELIPKMVVTAKLEHAVIDEFSLIVVTEDGELRVDGEGYKFHAGRGPAVQLSDPSDDQEVWEKLKAEVFPQIQELREAIEGNRARIEAVTVKYSLTPRDEAVSFEQMIDGFSEQLNTMQGILARAVVRFAQ